MCIYTYIDISSINRCAKAHSAITCHLLPFNPIIFIYCLRIHSSCPFIQPSIYPSSPIQTDDEHIALRHHNLHDDHCIVYHKQQRSHKSTILNRPKYFLFPNVSRTILSACASHPFAYTNYYLPWRAYTRTSSYMPQRSNLDERVLSTTSHSPT